MRVLGQIYAHHYILIPIVKHPRQCSPISSTRVPASTAIDVETFNRFFVDKVAKVRSCTSVAPPPVYSSVFPTFLATDNWRDRRRATTARQIFSCLSNTNVCSEADHRSLCRTLSNYSIDRWQLATFLSVSRNRSLLQFSARTFGYLITRVPDGYWNGYPGTRFRLLVQQLLLMWKHCYELLYGKLYLVNRWNVYVQYFSIRDTLCVL